MRIVVVSQTYSYGNGQASFTIRLAENLVRRGHQVMVLTPSETLTSYGRPQNGVQVEKIAAVHLAVLHPSIYLTPAPSARVRQLLREFKPDLVHVQDHYFLSSAVVREARRLRIPCLGTNHFLPENLLSFLRPFPVLQRWASAILWWHMLSIFNQLDQATTPSKTAAQILCAQQIHIPVRAISNGVDTGFFQPQPELDRAAFRQKYGLPAELPLCLYVGRLDGEKRLDTIVEAVTYLPQLDFHVALAGYGLHERALRRQVQTLGLEARISFIGYVPPEDLPALYNSADIFVMPSPEELQSIATLEAMSCGKPVLAADARALVELVKPGLNGYRFRPTDARDAARQIERLLNERARWTAMGQAGVERAQGHSLESTLGYYEEQYRQITAQIPAGQGVRSPREALRKSM